MAPGQVPGHCPYSPAWGWGDGAGRPTAIPNVASAPASLGRPQHHQPAEVGTGVAGKVRVQLQALCFQQHVPVGLVVPSARWPGWWRTSTALPWAGAGPGIPGMGQWVPLCHAQAVAVDMGASVPMAGCLVVARRWPTQGGAAGAWRDAGVGMLWGVGAREVPGCVWGRAGVTGAGTAWGGSGLAHVPWGTVGCCHPMDGACPKLPGGQCRSGQGQALGAGVRGAEHPPCTRVLFTCAPAAARTPDGCPKAPARPPALGAPSRLSGALAMLPSQGTGLEAAGAPRAWLGGTPCPPSRGTRHHTRVPPTLARG